MFVILRCRPCGSLLDDNRKNDFLEVNIIYGLAGNNIYGFLLFGRRKEISLHKHGFCFGEMFMEINGLAK